ncbi:hypothetical protein E2C01_076796 [Portunus trituberculatus]|uniref:Uncharacterized protein n=1 Tax=Portunus trituberculatus TaxID=210409 RepID=A0A5B7ICP6_PORTR|nr:hypothetical protein [Portunus trituberculatus]
MVKKNILYASRHVLTKTSCYRSSSYFSSSSPLIPATTTDQYRRDLSHAQGPSRNLPLQYTTPATAATSCAPTDLTTTPTRNSRPLPSSLVAHLPQDIILLPSGGKGGGGGGGRTYEMKKKNGVKEN